MKTSQRALRNRRVIRIVLVIATLAGAFFGNEAAPAGAPAWASYIRGAINGLLAAAPLVILEIYGMQTALGERLRRLPLPAYFGIKMTIYAVVIVGAYLLSRLLFLELYAQPVWVGPVEASALIFSVFMSVGFNLVFELGGLLGWDALKSLLTGRYVQPRAEQKTFLLVDMTDSTGLAERLGPIRFHHLLNDFFRDVSHAALECDAEIHKYVGEEAILTWSDDAGLADGAALSCPFMVRDAIEARQAQYLERFGAVPTFRAALHRGEIVAGEIGDLRREVAYVGDTLNVAARLLDAAKTVGHDVLVSIDLLRRSKVPDDLRTEDLPVFEVRGRAEPLPIAALDRR